MRRVAPAHHHHPSLDCTSNLGPRDSPEPFHFLEVTSPAPAATMNLKPQVKLLSRKPTLARDPTTNMANLSLKDDEEDEEEAKRRHQVEAEARMREGERLLAEKQKAYEEARRRIFGEEKEDEGKNAGRGSGRGRGNRGSRGSGRGRGNDGRGSDTSRSATSSRSATPSGATREQRGSSSPKPSILQKPESAPGSQRRGDGQTPAIREPRGPDGSGRGGFGFARRGAR